MGARDVLELASLKPFALIYEEIAFRSNATNRAEESALKARIADLISKLPLNKYHRQLVDAADTHIITTNYDYNLELSCGSDGVPASPLSESRYSVFRRRQIGNRFVWHVHGEVADPESILLGHDHYCGQLQKLRGYATANRISKLRPKSPFKVGHLSTNGPTRPILGLTSSLEMKSILSAWVLTTRRSIYGGSWPTNAASCR